MEIRPKIIRTFQEALAKEGNGTATHQDDTMKTYAPILRQICLWILAGNLAAATMTALAVQYPPGNFTAQIAFGCDCDTNNGAMDTPVSDFLAGNPVVSVTSSTKMPPANQVVPPHWTLFLPAPFVPPYAVPDCYPFYLEGWTKTLSTISAVGNTYPVQTPVTVPPMAPIDFKVPFQYYQDVAAASADPTGKLPVPSLQATGPQPYPWDINTTLTLQNGQKYVLEQQLAVGQFPNECAPPALETPVVYEELNGLLRISLKCADGTLITVYNATITATLENVAIPPPLNETIGGGVTVPLFQNWTWPRTIANGVSSGTIPGSADTVQASLALPGPTTINDLGLLVRANRAYTLTIAYAVPALNFGLTYMPPITIHTGLVPPCTNTDILITTTNCYGVTNTTYPPPCYGDLRGNLDILGAMTPASLVNIRAYNGPAGNSAAANLAAMPGTFQLTPVASDAYVLGQYPIPNTPYRMQATMSLSAFDDYEYFVSPVLYPVYVPCGAITDVGDAFVMCPQNPGIVRGTITLDGPVDPGYWGGTPALSKLQFAAYDGNGLPHDPAPTPGFPPDPTLQNVNFASHYLSYIKATGGLSAGATLLPPPLTSLGGGSAVTEFKNPLGMDGLIGVNRYRYAGDYKLRMAGLMGEDSLWSMNDLHLVFGAPVNLAYTIHETAPQFSNQVITCGTTLTRNIDHCFGLYTAQVVNLYPGLVTYNYATITVSGTGPGYTVGPFTINQVPFTTQTLLQNEAQIPLILPEGNYQYTATVYNTYGSLVLDDTTYFSVTGSCTNPCTPIIDCATNLVVDCDTAWSFTPPTFTTNCCGTNVTIDTLASFTNGICPKQITRIWQIIDCLTNISTCTQTVTLVDLTAPTIHQCATNVTFVGNSNCLVTIPDMRGQIMATDNCGSVTIAQTPLLTQVGAGVHPVVFTVADGCTNLVTCTNYVTVTCPTNCCDDCLQPYPVCYTNTVVPGYNYLANNLCQGTNGLKLTDLNVPDGTQLYIWNVTSQTYDVAYYDTGFGGWVDLGSAPINWTIPCGTGFGLFNPGATYSLIICGCEPDCPPPCLPPATGLVLVGAYGTGPATWADLSSCPPECGDQVLIWNGVTFVTYTYDNIGWTPPLPVIAEGQGVFVQHLPDYDCEPCTNELVINGSFEVPVLTNPNNPQTYSSIPGWTAMDSLNNSVGIELWNGTFGAMTAQHGNQHLEINSVANYVTVSQVITNVSTNCPARFCFWYTGRPGYPDNTFLAEVVGSGLSPVTNNPAVYTSSNSWLHYCVEFVPVATTLTIRFTGLNGGAASSAHIDHVSLTQCCPTNPCPAPATVTCPTDKSVTCGEPWTFDAPLVSSLCCGTNYSIVVTGSWTNGPCPQIATRVWQITDCYSNAMTCTQSVTLIDNTQPVITCASNLTVACGTPWAFTPPAVFDACSGTNVTVSELSTTTNGVCPREFTRAWVAWDACGNSNVCSQTVTVQVAGPPVPPVIQGIFADGTGIHIRFHTVPCYAYALECKVGLTNPVWDLCQTLEGDGTDREFLDPAPVPASRFYRVRVLCP